MLETKTTKNKSLRQCFKYIFLALNCQPSRNEIFQLAINPGCKLLKGTPSNTDISITGSDDARLCLQIKVILKAGGRRKCLARHQILLWERIKGTVAIYSLWMGGGGIVITPGTEPQGGERLHTKFQRNNNKKTHSRYRIHDAWCELKSKFTHPASWRCFKQTQRPFLLLQQRKFFPTAAFVRLAKNIILIFRLR